MQEAINIAQNQKILVKKKKTCFQAGVVKGCK